jgi:hypothetical protein
VKLANETVATAQQTCTGACFAGWIRKSGGCEAVVCRTNTSMRVHRFNGGAVNDKTQQQKRQRTGKYAVTFG